jgi:hypothetical protein
MHADLTGCPISRRWVDQCCNGHIIDAPFASDGGTSPRLASRKHSSAKIPALIPAAVNAAIHAFANKVALPIFFLPLDLLRFST